MTIFEIRNNEKTMNGLYIHVPFCQKRCIYCDFFSTTCGETEKQQYVEALKHEMALRANYLPDHTLSTIYLGGGTPSQLSPTQLDKILNVVFNLFSVDSNAEITIEVNPDDVTDNLASALRTLPVNRVSMGIQSFDGHLLRLLNRRHTAAEAEEAVDRLLRNGIDNISVDLMYGYRNKPYLIFNTMSTRLSIYPFAISRRMLSCMKKERASGKCVKKDS
jgi:coproporphyrinogen III oxidase-like Fe-S oxidoreductase